MDALKKTFVILSPGFPEDEEDSTCLPSQQLFAKTLKESYPELKVIVLAFHYPKRRKQYTWHNITVIPLRGSLYGRLFRFMLWRKAYGILDRIGKRHHTVGLLSFWCNESAFVGHCFASKKNLQHQIWILGQDARPRNIFLKWFTPSAQELIALSNSLATEFKQNYNIAPAHVIPNGIEPDFFKEHSPADRPYDILGVGSLTALKNYTLFIDVVLQLKKSFPAIRTGIIGDGPEKAILKKKIKAMGLDDNIRLIGRLPHLDVLSFMQQARILLHPSTYEGYSTVCLEALYAGCQVVSLTAAEAFSQKNWHIAYSEDELVSTCHGLLLEHPHYERILLHTMTDSVHQIMQCYGYDQESTS